MQRRAGLLLLAALATGAVLLRGPLAEANAARRLPGMRFAPDARLSRILSFGHRSTGADLLWLAAIGDLSRDFGDPARKRRWLEGVFDAVTKIEPGFITVYSLGATYLALLDGQPDRAIALLERGVAANPDDLKLPIELAMGWYTWKKDREKTVAVLKRVADDPRCDSITKGFYASLLVDGREDFAALAQWVPWLDHPNDAVKEMAELQSERAKRRIALRAVAEFQARHGRAPRRPMELAEPDLMAREVVPAVTRSFTIDATGKLHFARYDELELRQVLRAATQWVKQFRQENGRSPTQGELMTNHWVTLPKLPPGQAYAIDGDRVFVAK